MRPLALLKPSLFAIIAASLPAAPGYSRTDVPYLQERPQAENNVRPAARVVSGLLKRSDTPLSPRSQRTRDIWREPFEQFFSNRILWTYDGPAIIQSVAGKHIQVQCAVNFWVPESHPQKEKMVCTNPRGGYAGFSSDAVLGNGRLRRPDINSDEWRAFQLQQTERLVDAGCTSFQQDVALLNVQLLRNNGCYSDGSVRKFRAYLRENLTQEQLAKLGIKDIETFDYRENNFPSLNSYFATFQKESTRRYHQWLHNAINRYARRKYSGLSISFSGNLEHQHLSNDASLWLDFDFLISEAHGDRTNMVGLLRDLAKWMKTFRGTSAVTFPTKDVWLNQRSIATAYALGLVAIAPWDVFVAAGAPRFYGDPADFSPMFKMIRLNPTVFDNYGAGADWYDTYESAIPARAYIAQVEPVPNSSGTVNIRAQGLYLKSLHKNMTIYVGNRAHDIVDVSRTDTLRVDAGAPIAAGQPLATNNEPSDVLVTIRKDPKNPLKKAIHIVNWGHHRTNFLILKRSEFPSPPKFVITPENPVPTPISPRLLGQYYIFPLGITIWTVLF